MASGLVKTSGNHFEATYEHPWGGVSSEAYKTDIGYNELEIANGVIVKNGALNSATFDDFGFNTAAFSATLGTSLNFAFSIPRLGTFYILDSSGNIYVANFATKTFNFVVANALCINAFAYKIISGLVYIFSKTEGASFVFDPVAVTFTLNSNYVGGDYATVVDQYLITASTNQPTDAPAIKSNRVNWSSPDGFSIWDPAIDRSSGFNVLADVSDEITGLFAMANVAFVLRGQGLTQMTPTGIGIQPFDFTPLWSSDIGIGCLYPLTLAQYGNIAIWGNDSGFYLFTGGGAPQDICKQAKAAIFRDIKPIPTGTFVINQNVSAVIYNASATDSGLLQVTPDLRYTIAITQISTDRKTITIVFWTYIFNTGCWTRQTQSFVSNTTFSAITGSLDTVYIPQSNGLNYKQIPLYMFAAETAGVQYYKVLSLYEASVQYPANPTNAIPVSVSFKAEQIRIHRKPNIRGVAIMAKGKAGTTQTLTITVSNESRSVAFTSVIITDAVVRTYISNGMFTDENPQLTINSDNFDGSIIKAIMYGTFADGELP